MTSPESTVIHNSLVGPNAVVTGVSNGIGRAVSDALASHGATVVMLDKDVKGLELAYDEIVAVSDRRHAGAAGQRPPLAQRFDILGDVQRVILTTLLLEQSRSNR